MLEQLRRSRSELAAAALYCGVILAVALPYHHATAATGTDVETAPDPHAVQPERPTLATTKLGLTSHTQLGVAASALRSPSDPSSTAGFGDLALELKWRPLDHARWVDDFALLPAIKFPTGSLQRGTGTGTTDASLTLISSRSIGPASLDLNAGGTLRSGEGTGAPKRASLWSAALGLPLWGNIAWAAESMAFQAPRVQAAPHRWSRRSSDPLGHLARGWSWMRVRWLRYQDPSHTRSTWGWYGTSEVSGSEGPTRGESMDSRPHAPSLKELKALRQPVVDVNATHAESLSALEKLATWITDHVGSMGFFLIIFTWTLVWLGWNTLAPKLQRFDPYPAFVLWLFVSNMIQIFLMPLIMVGQNLQSRHSETRAQSDFEVNVKAEREVEAILMHLEAQAENIEKILKAMAAENRRA
jgi:uncharacterized membrane protein